MIGLLCSTFLLLLPTCGKLKRRDAQQSGTEFTPLEVQWHWHGETCHFSHMVCWINSVFSFFCATRTLVIERHQKRGHTCATSAWLCSLLSSQDCMPFHARATVVYYLLLKFLLSEFIFFFVVVRNVIFHLLLASYLLFGSKWHGVELYMYH